VIDALLDLPSHLLERLASALESGLVGPSPTPTTLGSVLGSKKPAARVGLSGEGFFCPWVESRMGVVA
jgi:hypothetical protein